MKKTFVCGFCLLMALLIACVASAETLTGTATGFGGDVVVTVELENDAVSAIHITGEKETSELGGAAIAQYNESLTALFAGRQLLFVNPSEIDTVAGATVTCEAVVKALTIALQGEAASDAQKVAKDVTSVSMPALSDWLHNRTNVAAASGARVPAGRGKRADARTARPHFADGQ